MRKQMKTVIVLVVLGLVLAASVSLKVYFLTDHVGATLFWRGDEAYLFLGAGHTGYRFSYLEYPLVVVREYFHAPPLPEHRRGSSLVIRVTPSIVERHVIDETEDSGTGPGFMTPFDDGFYAMCSGAVLCKWTANGFEPATEEEQRGHDGVNRLVRGSMNNQIVNGWHVRESFRSPGDHAEVEIGKNLVISVQNHATDVRAYPWVSVDLQRIGQAPERLYNADGSPRRVSKSEYAQVFRKTK
jgi:hypothetical protein